MLQPSCLLSLTNPLLSPKDRVGPKTPYLDHLCFEHSYKTCSFFWESEEVKKKKIQAKGSRLPAGGGTGKIPLPVRTIFVAKGERSNKPTFQNQGPQAYCPNVTGRARSLNSKSKRVEVPLTLKVRMDIIVEDHIFPVRALVYTGAEVNIIRRGVIPETFLHKDSHPLTLGGGGGGE